MRDASASLSAAPQWTLQDRRYLREKVVVLYEQLWSGDPAAVDFTQLLNLKVNASWLQSHIASAPTAELMGPKKRAVRVLFAECCDRLVDAFAIDVQCHAMETLSGLFLGVGCRTFHDPVAEVLELLCGIEAADGAFGALFGRVKGILSSDRRSADAAALRRSAVRLLLSLTAAAPDLPPPTGQASANFHAFFF